MLSVQLEHLHAIPECWVSANCYNEAISLQGWAVLNKQEQQGRVHHWAICESTLAECCCVYSSGGCWENRDGPYSVLELWVIHKHGWWSATSQTKAEKLDVTWHIRLKVKVSKISTEFSIKLKTLFFGVKKQSSFQTWREVQQDTKYS